MADTGHAFEQKQIQELYGRICSLVDGVAKYFPPQYKITVLARNPLALNADLMATSDDPMQAAGAIAALAQNKPQITGG